LTGFEIVPPIFLPNFANYCAVFAKLFYGFPWRYFTAVATMNISLPEAMKAEVEQFVANEGYGNTSEFFRDLVRNYLKQRQERELESMLLERLKDTDEKAFNINDVRTAVASRLNKDNKRRT
jgi:antitoxin ParD1/3/4